MRIPGLPPIPGPAAVVGSAMAAAEAVEMAIALVPRAVEAMRRVEELLDRADALVTRVDAVLDRAEAAMTAADTTSQRAAVLVDDAEKVARRAGRAVDGVAGLSDRVDVSLQVWEPTLRRLAPQADRFASSLADGEVDAAIALIDRLPVVLEHMENDVLPVLVTLDRVGPDLHEMLEVVEDLRRVVTGLPGVSLLRRRGDDEPPPLEHEGPDAQPRRRR